MSRSIIIPDIHTKHNKAQKILDKNPHDLAIFMGDFFDAWDDTTMENKETALWVKELLKNPKNILILGNHDAVYRWPKNPWTMCSGFTESKSKAINSVLTKEDWDKFKLFEYHQGFYLSHAGICKYLFAHPIHGLSIEHLNKCCDEAVKASEAGLYSMYVGAGRDRGGRQSYGGITWIDWDSLEVMDKISQITGHTESAVVREERSENSVNYCIDTGLRHVGFLEDGKFTYEEI